MELGVLISLSENCEAEFKRVHDIGLRSCQLSMWNTKYFTDEYVEKVKVASKKYNVSVSTCWVGWSGTKKWGDFYQGPLTLGFVPITYRQMRMNEFLQGAEFACKLGVKNVATHVGFLPENPDTTEYRSLIYDLRFLVEQLSKSKQCFLFETGQETPITLLRTIKEIGLENTGINFDTANLILYGRSNSLDALDLLWPYIRDMHAKDGCFPTDVSRTGQEKPLGEGQANIPAIIKKLKEVGYDGPITIEREISGEEQTRDIIKAKSYIEKLWNQ